METRSAALVLALVYVVLGFNRGFSIYDEAIPVMTAMRILDRGRPYRDFWIIYPPTLVMAVLGSGGAPPPRASSGRPPS